MAENSVEGGRVSHSAALSYCQHRPFRMIPQKQNCILDAFAVDIYLRIGSTAISFDDVSEDIFINTGKSAQVISIQFRIQIKLFGVKTLVESDEQGR